MPRLFGQILYNAPTGKLGRNSCRLPFVPENYIVRTLPKPGLTTKEMYNHSHLLSP